MNGDFRSPLLRRDFKTSTSVNTSNIQRSDLLNRSNSKHSRTAGIIRHKNFRIKNTYKSQFNSSDLKEYSRFHTASQKDKNYGKESYPIHSNGSLHVSEKRDIIDLKTIKSIKQTIDDKSQIDIPFMIEPSNSKCINIQSLEQEIEQTNKNLKLSKKMMESSNLKLKDKQIKQANGQEQLIEVDRQRPDKVYLKNCRIYSQQNLQTLKLNIKSYQFKPDDFKDNLLSLTFFDRLRQQEGIEFETEKLSEQDLALILKAESLKMFVDYIFHDQILYMVVKTWQKVNLCIPTDDLRLCKEDGPILKIEELRNQNGKLSNDQFTASKYFFYIKTLQVFNKFGEPMDEPILLEQVHGQFDSFRVYDASFLHHHDNLYFFKRRFVEIQSETNLSQIDQKNSSIFSSSKQMQSSINLDKNKQFVIGQSSLKDINDISPQLSLLASSTKKIKENSYLQLYSFNFNTGEKISIDKICIKEEDWHAQELQRQSTIRKNMFKNVDEQRYPLNCQYNVVFSQEFGPKSPYETNVTYNSQGEFLYTQYFSLQKYITGNYSNPFLVFQLGDYTNNKGKQCQTANQKLPECIAKFILVNSNENIKIDSTADLNRQIQCLNHIRNLNDSKNTLDFLIQNMYAMVGISIKVDQKEDDVIKSEVKLSIYKRKSVHQYQRIWNIGGIVPQMVRVDQQSDNDQSGIDQYFFIDSRNNIQLLLPNYESKMQCQRRIEQIREAIKFQNNYQDYLIYKKIIVQKVVDSQPKCNNVFQKIDHLKAVLTDDVSCSQSFNFFQDKENQILYLSESKSELITIYLMKEERKQLCRGITQFFEDDQTSNDPFLMKILTKQSQTKQNMLKYKKYKSAQNNLRVEICDIDNQTSQVIKGTRQDKLLSNEYIQSYQINDNDHDEPYTFYHIRVTEDNINILQEVDDAGFGIIRLTEKEKLDYCLIDDFQGIKKKVKMFNLFESYHLKLIKYVQAKDNEFCLFLFAVYNPDKQNSDLMPQEQPLIKKSYIFVRKTYNQMLSIFSSNGCKEIISHDDQVIILKNSNKFDTIKFSNIKRFQFKNEQVDEIIEDLNYSSVQDQIQSKSKLTDSADLDQFYEVSITLCKYYEEDKTKINFLPFIYQEKNDRSMNKFIIYDIINNYPSQYLSINNFDCQREYLYEDNNGYNKYLLCRSSDIHEYQIDQIKNTNKSNIQSKVKYQLFTLFSENIGRLHCEEFIISHDSTHTIVQTFGLKEILFSNQIISEVEWEFIKRSEVLPYFDKFYDCKGCQLKIFLGPNDDGVLINMIDGENSNIYFYKSEIVLCGNTKMILREDEPLMFVTVTSTLLRSQIINHTIQDRSEAHEILGRAIDIMMRMKIPNIDYLVLNSYEDVIKRDFFRTQEILQGKSLADISLSSAESWREAIRTFRQEWKVLDCCLVENVIDGDVIRRDHMQQCNFYPKLNIVQLDLNFMSTIERAFKLNSFKSLKLILTHILDVIDTFEYQRFIMYDLPIIIQQKQIQIDDFYNLSLAERNNTEKGFCNLEIELNLQELPLFSNLEFDSFRIQKFDNFKQIELEITDAIWTLDEKKGLKGVKDSDKKFETEYFYIDYHHMILGEQLRNYRQAKPMQQFNDLYYAKIIASKVGESQRNTFFLQQSIQKIIQSQWMQTKYIQKYIFVIYLLLYCIPMGLSCFQILDSLMFNIAIWPAFLLLLIETIQFKEHGLDYFQIGWNLIDVFQLIVFGILYYMRYLGEDRNILFFPELKLVNISLTFMKMMFFIRIFEDYGFLVQMIILCIQDLVPFFMTYLLFLNFFSICFIVLNCDIDGEISGTPVLSHYQLMLLQVYRTALGELSMPGYSQSEVWSNEHEDDIFLSINKCMIWFLWVISTFFMFVIMTNFNIAQITSTYERVRSLEKKISYELKADMNYETFILIANFTTLKNYRCLVFANSKNAQNKHTEMLDEQFIQVKKALIQNNQQFETKNEEHFKQLKKLQDQQHTLKNQFKERNNELLLRYDSMKISLVDQVKERLHLK